MSSSSALARLWAHAHQALTALCASLLPLDTLGAGEQRRLRAWLRALEGFCRRLALAEALTMARSATPTAPGAPARTTTHATRAPRPSALRLWPKPKRAAPRIRLLGPATSVREIQQAQRRAILIARLAVARTRRKPPHVRLADRIEALQRFLDAPAAAVRRFARKLSRTPRIARAVIARRTPASPFLATEYVSECDRLSYAAALDSA